MKTWKDFWTDQFKSTWLMVKGWFILIGPTMRQEWVFQESVPGRTKPNRYAILTWADPKLYLYGNDEDGIHGDAQFLDEHAWLPTWYRLTVYQWSALRNPVGNLRWSTSCVGGPFFRAYFFGKRFYFQMGYRPDNGWPVLSAGSTPKGGFDY